MTFIEKMKMQAKQDIKTIVLPESKDIRTLEATEIVLKEGFANIILIGNPQEINELAEKNNINLNGAQIVNPATSADFSKYANDLYELRKNKGMTLDQAKELLKTNSRYFATMMVKEGDADGFVSGASHPTSDTLRPALQILKAAPGTKLVSAFFVMVLPDKEFGDDGVFIFDISSYYKLSTILGNNMYGENREDVAYMWQNYFDSEENVVEMELAFFIKEEDGRFTRFEEVHQQRAYTEKEVLKMLKKAGFTNVKTYGDFTFEDPKEDSERIFFVCKK